MIISTHGNISGEPEFGRWDKRGQVSMFEGRVLEGLRHWLQQPPKQRSGESQRRSKRSSERLSACGEFAAQGGPQEKRNWLPEANFPWMLL